MLLLILLIVGIVLVVGGAHLSKHTYEDVGSAVCLVLGVLALAAVVLLACFWVGNVSTETGYIASQHQLYESLVYQAENCIFENDNDLGKAELVKQITEWNTSLAHNREMCKSIWVGFLYYQCYDQFEFIPLSLIK
jgi:hypothetical protein